MTEETEKKADKTFTKDYNNIGVSANITYKLGFDAGYNLALEEDYDTKQEFINKLKEAEEIIRKMLFVLGEYRVDYHNNPHFELIDKASNFIKVKL